MVAGLRPVGSEPARRSTQTWIQTAKASTSIASCPSSRSEANPRSGVMETLIASGPYETREGLDRTSRSARSRVRATRTETASGGLAVTGCPAGGRFKPSFMGHKVPRELRSVAIRWAETGIHRSTDAAHGWRRIPRCLVRCDTVAVLTREGGRPIRRADERSPVPQSKYRCRITVCRTPSRRSCHRRLSSLARHRATFHRRIEPSTDRPMVAPAGRWIAGTAVRRDTVPR